jgi:hypothetical protein
MWLRTAIVCLAANAAARSVSSSRRTSSVDSFDTPLASASHASSSRRRSSLSASSSNFWSGSRSDGWEGLGDTAGLRLGKKSGAKPLPPHLVILSFAEPNVDLIELTARPFTSQDSAKDTRAKDSGQNIEWSDCPAARAHTMLATITIPHAR